MKIEEAKAIPLSEILTKLDCKPSNCKGYDVWYHSPFRIEKTPSFHIHLARNVWYDFGEAEGGDVIDFACHYLKTCGKSHTVSDGLRWLTYMEPHTIPAIEILPAEITTEKNLSINSVSPLQHRGLINYLQSRGIPLSLAKLYLKEAIVSNQISGSLFYALCWSNDDGGYELRNAFLKSCIGSKRITVLRGTKYPPSEVHVFEGMMDFLSALADGEIERFVGDAIILNSTVNLPQIIPYIKHYTYKLVHSWLDNDDTGWKTEKVLEEFVMEDVRIEFQRMNEIYMPHKDVNAWRKFKLGLK